MMSRSNKRSLSKKRRFSRKRTTPLSKGISNFLGRPTRVVLTVECPIFARFRQADQLGEYSFQAPATLTAFQYGGVLLANNAEFVSYTSRYAYYSFYALEMKFVPGTLVPGNVSPTLNSFPTLYLVPSFSCDNPAAAIAADADQALMCRIGDLSTSAYSKFYSFPGSVFNNGSLLPIAGSQAILPCGTMNPGNGLVLLGSKTFVTSRVVDGNAIVTPIVGYLSIKLYFNFFSSQAGNAI